MKTLDEIPIARCPANEVEVFDYPFYIKKGVGIEADFLLLDIHLFHMTSEEKAVMGDLVEIADEEQMKAQGYPVDDRGVFLVE